MEGLFQALHRQVVSCTLRTNDSAVTGMTPMRIQYVPFVGTFAYLMAVRMHVGQMNEAQHGQYGSRPPAFLAQCDNTWHQSHAV